MLRIDHHTGITSCTAGRVNTDGIIQASANKTIRIVVTQVLLRGEGDLTQVCQRVDGVRRDAEISQTLLVEGRVQGDLDALLEFLHLQRFQLLSWHFFDFRLPAFTVRLDSSHDFLVSHNFRYLRFTYFRFTIFTFSPFHPYSIASS